MTYKLLQGDCIEHMKKLPSESIDLVITDPPYGINFSTNHRKVKIIHTTHGIENDKDNLDLLSQAVQEIYRLLKNNTHFYWFTRWDMLPKHMQLIGKFFKIKNVLIWVKNNWSMGDLKGAYANQYEAIIFAQKGRKNLNPIDGIMRHTDVLMFPRIGSNQLIHNHQKPENLLKFLILKSSKPGDLILDPFAGSGSIGVAAESLNRNCILIELTKEYCDVIKERLSNIQLSLFCS